VTEALELEDRFTGELVCDCRHYGSFLVVRSEE
jgi:hypothetical protein